MISNPCAFGFVYTNFADPTALHANFRHLEKHLQKIGCGTGASQPAVLMPKDGVYTLISTAGQDIEWVVESDPDAILGGFGADDTEVQFGSTGLYLIEYQFMASWDVQDMPGWATFEFNSDIWSSASVDHPWQQGELYTANAFSIDTLFVGHGATHTVEISDIANQVYILGFAVFDFWPATFFVDGTDGNLFGENADNYFTWLKITKLNSFTSGYMS